MTPPDRRFNVLAPRRLIALLLALLLPAGAGLIVLGRGRAVLWGISSVFAFALMRLDAVWGAALGALVGLGSIIDAAIARPAERPTSHFRTAGFLMLFVLLASGARMVERQFWVEPFRVPSSSMAPTLLAGDHFVVDRWNAKVARGDIIVFRSPAEPGSNFVQRVVATGGDLVALRDGLLVVNGKAISGGGEPCDRALVEDAHEDCVFRREELDSGRAYSVAFGRGEFSIPSFPDVRHGCPERMEEIEQSCRVPENTVFTMGDYRDNSLDGRYFGPVPLEDVKGRALQIHFSVEASGIRWNRVGVRLD